MTSMKIEPRKAEQSTAIMNDGPEYPYGLRICLGTDELKKLGIEKLPELGKEIAISAKGTVCAVSENENLYGKNQSLDLQITDMELE